MNMVEQHGDLTEEGLHRAILNISREVFVPPLLKPLLAADLTRAPDMPGSLGFEL